MIQGDSELESNLLIAVWWCLVPWLSAWLCLGQARAATVPDDSHIVRMRPPANILGPGLAQGGEPVRRQLCGWACEQLAKRPALSAEHPDTDLIVLFLDDNGTPLLPDLAAARSSRAIKGAPSPVPPLPNELSFTFNSSDQPWASSETNQLRAMLNDFYPVAKAVYGPPAFNITVNLRKDTNIASSGIYFPSVNEMVIRDVSQFDVLCHEMIHAFRDDNLIRFDAYEEGMTRAAEVEVFNRLPAYSHFDVHHSYGQDRLYEALNRPAIGSRRGNFFAGYINSFLRYQLGGYAWAKPLLENSNFFVAFNRELYTQMLSDPSTSQNEFKLRTIAAGLAPTVEGIPYQAWYADQHVLNFDPPTGFFLYHQIEQFVVDYFSRDVFGQEVMQTDATVQWAFYDYQGTLLNNGSSSTAPRGWFRLNPQVPSGYNGRIALITTALSPDGPVTNRSSYFWGDQSGVFGVIAEANTGVVTITPLDDPDLAETTDVVNGGFRTPSLAGLKGRFRAVFSEPGGMTASRQFTKDASDYFLILGEAQTLSVASSNPSNGVIIAPSPTDITGQGDGTTPFARRFPPDSLVTLTAPASANGRPFVRWQQDGLDSTVYLTTDTTTDAHHIMTAVYQTNLFLEAEAGAEIPPMMTGNDPLASGRQYVFTPSNELGQVNYTVTIPAAGTYFLWCRALALNANANSFYLTMNASTVDTTWTNIFDVPPAVHWQWSRVYQRISPNIEGTNSFNLRILHLEAGPFQLVVGGRESNTLLDRILITNDLEFQPTDSEPLLLVQRRQSQLVLTWPTNAVGFVVERTASLKSPIAWEPVTNVPTIKDRDLTISVDASTGNHFYHLRRP